MACVTLEIVLITLWCVCVFFFFSENSVEATEIWFFFCAHPFFLSKVELLSCWLWLWWYALYYSL